MDNIFFDKRRIALVKTLYRQIIKSIKYAYQFDSELVYYLSSIVRFDFNRNTNAKIISEIELNINKGNELLAVLQKVNNTSYQDFLIFTSQIINLTYGQKLNSKAINDYYNMNDFTYTSSIYTLCANDFINAILQYENNARISIDHFDHFTPIPEYLKKHIENDVLPHLKCDELKLMYNNLI